MLMGLWHRKSDEQEHFDQKEASPYHEKEAYSEAIPVDPEAVVTVTHGGTRHDALDMHRVGKQQELKVWRCPAIVARAFN